MSKKSFNRSWKVFSLDDKEEYSLENEQIHRCTFTLIPNLKDDLRFHLDQESLEDLTRISSSFTSNYHPIESSEEFTFFPSWNTWEIETFFSALQRHSRFKPEAIAKDIGSKNVFQVCRAIEDLQRNSLQFPHQESLKRRPQAIEISHSRLKREIIRAEKRIKKEEKQAKSRKFTISPNQKANVNPNEIFCFDEWKKLASLMCGLEMEILEEFFFPFQEELELWLSNTIHSLIPIACERDRTLGKAKNIPTKRIVISDLDVKTHFQALEFLNSTQCQCFYQPFF